MFNKKNKLLITIITIIIIIVVIILIIYLNFKNVIKTRINNIFRKDDNDIYLFWTGGYDSTFRLCQILINEKKNVIPIYISYKHLDNSKDKKYKRKNHKEELNAIKLIKEKLIKKFPHLRNNIKPLITINNLNISNNIKKHMYNLWKRKLNHRPMSQYGGLAQVTFDLNKNIEIAVENSKHSTMRRIVYKYIKNVNNKNIIKTNDKDINIFKKLIFPTIDITKKQMLNISKKYNYNDILELTWSCWFPVNGAKCNKCPMCLQRII